MRIVDLPALADAGPPGAKRSEGVEETRERESGIGSRLRAARERLGLSREALAFHAGISWSAIAQVESGRRSQLRPSTLLALATALGLTIDYLVSGRYASTAM